MMSGMYLYDQCYGRDRLWPPRYNGAWIGPGLGAGPRGSLGAGRRGSLGAGRRGSLGQAAGRTAPGALLGNSGH